ncbi:polymer-forming cytoskeletal protein [Erwinia sp. P6884]|uniref:bactofilin family protein n=1 Tax=Erwinia sp. P6884 TaxID=3141450 RepID=UPI00318791ED
MPESNTHYYLWGIWIFWGGSLIAFALSLRIPMLIALGGMGSLFLLLILRKRHNERMMTSVFNLKKKEEVQPAKAALTPASPATSPVAPVLPAEENGFKETTISPGTLLRGEISIENNITINGIVEGDVTSQKVTQIGKEGQVIGKVKSQKLIVNGLLKGSCYAQMVIIMSRGRIEGDVFAGEFSIEKGGVFIGNSHLLGENSAPGAKKEKKQDETAGQQPAAAAPEVNRLLKKA